MGVFFDPRPSRTSLRSAIETEIRDALETSPGAIPDVAREAAERSTNAIAAAPTEPEFKTMNFLAALGVLLFFVLAAIATDALDLPDSSKVLYGFATTILGIIVGLLGGEKSSSS
jgi:VIT1/CCC1 family predicted Fe2+/Mn2+ transporter